MAPVLSAILKRRFIEAQQKIRTRLGAARELLTIGGIDADEMSCRFQGADALLEMAKRRVGKATDVDHIGARIAQGRGAREQGLDRKRGRIDDLGENAN